jgi:hypothetical protein
MRYFSLGVAAICVFVVVAAIMLQLMPAPLREFDYMVIGSVSTLVALLALFLVVISTAKSTNIFFKKRRK